MHTRTFVIPLALIVALTLAVPTLAFHSQGAWQQVNTPISPDNRVGHSLTVINNVVYLFGGYTAAGLRNDLWKFDPVTNSWTNLGSGGPPARIRHAAAAVDGKLVIHGGTDGATKLDDLWIYDPGVNAWTQGTPVGPQPPALMEHRAVVSGGKLYLVGGIKSDGPSNELWMYDSTANSWSEKEDYPGPYGGAYGAAVFTPGSNIMVGGTTGDDYYVYNPGANSWEAKTAVNFPNRTSPGTAQVGAAGYIFGGQDTATAELSTEVWMAEDVGGTSIVWEPLPPEMPPIMPNLVLIPEKYSPVLSSRMCAFPNAATEPAVLLYGRSWAYAAGSHNPTLGDASTWLFWPGGSPAGPLAAVVVWPPDAAVTVGQQHTFNATGRDAKGFYVPITPTWSAAGGVIDGVGRYTAGDWPGTYYVAAEAPSGKMLIMLQGQAPVTVTGTETCPDLAPGASYTHTFAMIGAYPYHDRVGSGHYTGTVTVNPTLGEGKATHDVSITAAGFDPASIVIARNDTVRWTNTDTAIHAVGGGKYRPQYRLYLPLVLRQ